MPRGGDIYCISLQVRFELRFFDLFVLRLQEADYTPRYGFDSCEDDFYHWVLRHLGENYMKLAASTLSGYDA